MKVVIDMALRGVSVSIAPLWGLYSRREGVRLRIQAETNNGVSSRMCVLTRQELDGAEDPAGLVTEKLLEMERAARGLADGTACETSRGTLYKIEEAPELLGVL